MTYRLRRRERTTFLSVRVRRDVVGFLFSDKLRRLSVCALLAPLSKGL